MKNLVKVIIGGSIIYMYGYLSRCVGYMQGVLVTATAYEEKRSKEDEAN